ncbi:MAG: hypothetical protein KGK16_13945 [Bradyrhizobium sp.]|nr:hypothetical protein [Bradyrhizobium sp.]
MTASSWGRISRRSIAPAKPYTPRAFWQPACARRRRLSWPLVFVLYGLFAAAVRDRIVTRPNVMKWLRRIFAGGFVALGAKLTFPER